MTMVAMAVFDVTSVSKATMVTTRRIITHDGRVDNICSWAPMTRDRPDIYAETDTLIYTETGDMCTETDRYLNTDRHIFTPRQTHVNVIELRLY